MKGTITIAGDRDYGVHIEAHLECEDILDKSYLKDIISKLMNDNEAKKEAND